MIESFTFHTILQCLHDIQCRNLLELDQNSDYQSPAHYKIFYSFECLHILLLYQFESIEFILFVEACTNNAAAEESPIQVNNSLDCVCQILVFHENSHSFLWTDTWPWELIDDTLHLINKK